MTKQEILRHIDHTQLKAFCTWEDIKKLCDEAIEYKDVYKRQDAKSGKNISICRAC